MFSVTKFSPDRSSLFENIHPGLRGTSKTKEKALLIVLSRELIDFALISWYRPRL